MINSDFNRQVVAAGAPVPAHRYLLYTAFLFFIYMKKYFFAPVFPLVKLRSGWESAHYAISGAGKLKTVYYCSG